jgi:hypothetical protein
MQGQSNVAYTPERAECNRQDLSSVTYTPERAGAADTI